MKTLSTFLLVLFLAGCQTDNRRDPRAYVEGKISESQLELSKIQIKIKSEGTVVAETIPEESGNFIASGPLFSDVFSLSFNSKIKSFKTSSSGCKISTDSLEILIPTGTTYITFTDIILK